MKRLNSIAAAAILIAGFPGVALAQVYGADDDPYAQNPYASNFVLPDAKALNSGGAGTDQTAPPPQQQQADAAKSQPATASGSSQTAQKQAKP